MKNNFSPRFAKLQRLRNVFLLSVFFAVTIFAAVSFNSCSSGPTSPGVGAGMQTTTIYGRVADESGAVLTGVAVSAGTQTAMTDANGFFILKDAIVPQGRAVVIAKKAGYFNAARAEIPNANGTTRMTFSMMSNAATGS